jgi:hypothetical protein
MLEIKPFEVGEAVSVVRAGRPVSIHYVDAEEHGILTLDDGTLWTNTGHPISADAAGGRLTSTLDQHHDKVEMAKLIGRIKEMLDYIVQNDRVYNMGRERLVSLERMLMPAIAEALSSRMRGDVPSRKRAVDLALRRLTVRLQAAERAEVMRLSSRKR